MRVTRLVNIMICLGHVKNARVDDFWCDLAIKNSWELWRTQIAKMLFSFVTNEDSKTIVDDIAIDFGYSS